MHEALPSRRMRWLHTPWLIGAIYLGSVGLLLSGLLRSPFPYSDWRFVVGYFGTELQVLALLIVATAICLPASRIGLQLPRLVDGRRLFPLALLALATVIAWIGVRSTLPSTPGATSEPIWMILRSVVLVGITEEWMYRGILLAFLAARLGLRRGAVAMLALFGMLHLANGFGGQPWPTAFLQMATTFVLGSVFLMAALGSNSLLLPMLGHALYDGALIDMQRMVTLGANAGAMSLLAVTSVVLGVIALRMVARIGPDELPYMPRTPAGQVTPD